MTNYPQNVFDQKIHETVILFRPKNSETCYGLSKSDYNKFLESKNVSHLLSIPEEEIELFELEVIEPYITKNSRIFKIKDLIICDENWVERKLG